MDWPLWNRIEKLRSSGSVAPESVLEQFLQHVAERRLELYPAQEEAVLELLDGKNVILNTPTGSGKSLVASALHFDSLARGRRSVYTSPIKALVNEKFLALCREFGPERVGLATGDGAVNAQAPVLCCTAEILANDALRLGAQAPIDDVVMDEFHYYADRDRGVAWQIPLLTLARARFLLMSATLGDTTFFETALTSLNGRATTLVRSNQRPVPLDFRYSEDPLHEALAKLLREGRAPVYIVYFTQKEAASGAQDLLSVDFCSKEEKKWISDALYGVSFPSPFGKDLSRLLRHGVGLHHAGLLPRYRILVEKLAQQGLLKLICGTDTLGVGVNVPIRSVLLTQLCKFDGQKTSLLSVRDFHQISGRAGRKGFDDAGSVVVQAPAHVIENLRQEQKAAGDPKKTKKLVKRKPPEKGFVPWTRDTLDRLVSGQPEALVSRFQVSHAMLLNVLARPEDGCRTMRQLIRDSHESPRAKRQHGKRAFQLFRSLIDRRIIEFNPPGTAPKLRVNVDLQQDFSLNHTLALFLLDAIPLLDPESPDYARDLLTLVESILENPDAVLRRQLDRAKGDKIAELKQQGMDYHDRMAELENVEYPKPNRDFIYARFNEFAAAHPWIDQENIRPKSIAREMFETFQSFDEYVRDYQLQRSEGVLLRYLSDVYKVISQTVPDPAKSDEMWAIEEYFRTMIRGVDSSLLTEWQSLQGLPTPEGPEALARQRQQAQRSEQEQRAQATRAFAIRVRNEVFRFIRLLAGGDVAGAMERLADASGDQGGFDEASLKSALELYREDHGRILTDTRARAPRYGTFSGTPGAPGCRLSQVLVDEEGHNDWELEFVIDPLDVTQPAEGGETRFLRLLRMAPIA